MHGKPANISQYQTVKYRSCPSRQLIYRDGIRIVAVTNIGSRLTTSSKDEFLMVGKEPAKKRTSPDTPAKIPTIVAVTRWLFVLLGVIWLVLGVWSIARIGQVSSSVPNAVLWIIAVLMLINAALLTWIGWGIGRGSKLYFYFAVLLLAGNIFFTFTDEFGVIDLLTLIINVLLLVLLIAGHARFLNK